MVSKRLKPPSFRWITQDYNGPIIWHKTEPIKRTTYWRSDIQQFHDISLNTWQNSRWADTKIDLEAVKRGEYDYEFSFGILRKIPAKERKK